MCGENVLGCEYSIGPDFYTSSLFLLLVGNNQGLCGSSEELSEPAYDYGSFVCFLSSPTH